MYTTYAAFPTTGLTTGDLAWATDRKCLYRWSGTAWETIGISSRHGNYADIGDPANYPESSLYQADDTGTLYMIVTAAWQQITIEPSISRWAAGAVEISVANTEKSTASTSYAKVKEIRIASGGTITISFDLKSSFAGVVAHGLIYKNGVAHGTDRTNDTTTYQTFSQDLIFNQDDLVQLYMKQDSTGSAWCRNFKLKANKVHLHTVVTD
jgi:hypothetical protein